MDNDIDNRSEDFSKFVSLGIRTADLQHEKFFKLLDELRLYSTINEDKSFVKSIFAELESYSIYHFDYEERMMRRSNFSGLDEHVKQHEVFKLRLAQFKQSFEYDNQVVDVQMLSFLRKWFVLHISEADTQYADFIKSRKKYEQE